VRTRITRIGRTVPERFEGTVLAVWRKAVAVELGVRPRAHVLPSLVTLVREDVPMTAATMALRVPAGFEFSALGTLEGDLVRLSGGELTIAGRDGSALLVADARGAKDYDGTPRSAGAITDATLLAAVSEAARTRRELHCQSAWLATAALARCDDLLGELAGAVARGHVVTAKRAASGLIGLGPGLTPSGDDALCGFLLGRRLSVSAHPAADRAIRHVASCAGESTTWFSAVHLELAAHDRFGEALLGLASALADGRWPEVEAMLVRCLDQGATSGADGILGLVAGVRSGLATPHAVNA